MYAGSVLEIFKNKRASFRWERGFTQYQRRDSNQGTYNKNSVPSLYEAFNAVKIRVFACVVSELCRNIMHQTSINKKPPPFAKQGFLVRGR